MIYELIDRLIEREGGFVNHPDDRGGPTKYGITLKTLQAYRRDPTLTITDIEQLELEEARQIYFLEYWQLPKFNLLGLPPILVEMIFDAGVHHGPGTAVKILQRAIGTKDDGILGPITRRTAERQEPDMLAARYMGARVEYLGEIITKDPDQATFAHGWMSRMREFITAIPAVDA